MKKKDDVEIAKRRDEAIKRALETRPRPHGVIKKKTSLDSDLKTVNREEPKSS